MDGHWKIPFKWMKTRGTPMFRNLHFTVNHYSPSLNIIKHLWIPPYIGGIPTFYHPFLGYPLFRKALEAKQAGTDALQALDAVLRLRL